MDWHALSVLPEQQVRHLSQYTNGAATQFTVISFYSACFCRGRYYKGYAMCELHNAGLWAFDECNEYLDFQGLAYFHELYGQGISDAAQPSVRTERRVDFSAR